MKAMNRQFSVLARYYDTLNYNADYEQVADYIESVFRLYNKTPELVLDLACGTGELTIQLARRGYDMIGLDLSSEMLNEASSKAYNENENELDGFDCESAKKILWINQDMCGFELYGTVDAIVCCFDSLNYILDEADIEKCFKSAYHYLNPGGLFLFDVTSEYKFEKIYGNNDIILEKDGVLCAWRNDYDKQSQICEFYISLFVKQKSAEYKRFDEIQRERCYSEDWLMNLLNITGFSDIKMFCDFDITKQIYEHKHKQEHKQEQDKKTLERACFAALKEL